MSALALSLLGPFEAILGVEPVSDFRTRKVQALLIYLAAEPEAHEREMLLDLLWPGLPERSARANLRQIMYYLRQALPAVGGKEGRDVDVIVANRQDVQLNPEAEVTVDTRQFETLLAEAHGHEHLDLFLCHACADTLQEAAGLYRDNFLSSFYLEDSTVFEEWALTRREYFRRKALDALGILATMALRRQDYAAAQGWAQKQLEFDNLRESAHRQLMQALALSGRREEALAAYDNCRRVLVEELSMAPSTQTTDFAEKIRAGDSRFELHQVEGVRGYELKERIGEGSYGAIFRAVQPGIRREVAVKVIRRKYADNPAFIRRFEAEAQTIARLEAPGIVPLYDYWREPAGAFLVMRYMRGGSLLQELKGGSWKPERAAAMAEQIAAALTMAHRQGVVHRDIKPGNILLDEAGNAYLADFGIAKHYGREGWTGEGEVMGTLDYVSPEQILGERVTPQTDIYSLGAVLYETLTGEKPFGDASVARLLYSHIHEPIPLVIASRPDIPSQVDNVLQKATAKKAAERYATAVEMAAAFRGAVHGLEPEVEDDGWTIMIGPVEVTNPYKGLQAFQEADAEDFFGREALVQQLVGRLGTTAHDWEARFLALVGPSGSGKSSVIRAGLIPALRNGALPGSDKWFVTAMVPGANPLQGLEQALWRVAVEPPPDLIEPMARDSGGLLRTLRRILPAEPEPPLGGAQLLLVIDQFEELYTLVEDEERRRFFLDSLLMALQAPRSPLRLLITLRADFYDRPLHDQDWGQLLKQNSEIVLPLNRTELTWAIREPARRAGVRLEEGLAEEIVADVTDQPGALPLLQYAMTELFESREGRLIRSAVYEKLGGVQGALGKRAEAVYGKLDGACREAAQQMFLRLITLGEGTEDTRRRVLRSELEALSAAAAAGKGRPAPLLEALGRFGAARFLTFDRDPLTRAPTVEVAHEALIREWPRLRGWLAESRNDVRLQRLLAQAAGEWHASGRDSGYLLREARLDQFAGWAASTPVSLTGDERAYVDASIAARQQRLGAEEERRQRELQAARDLAEVQQKRAEEQVTAAQRLRRRAVYLAGALVIAAMLAVLALWAGQQASANAAEAQVNADLAQAHAAEAQISADEAAANAALAQTRQAEEALQRAAAEEARATAVAAQVVADRERDVAEEQARLAFSRELVASSILNLEDDPELSILLALHAVTQAGTFQAQGALHEALQNSHLLQRAPGDLGRFALNPDGSRLAIEIEGPEGIETVVLDAATLDVLHKVPGDLADHQWVDGDRLPTITVGDEPGTSIFTLWDAAGLPVSSSVLPFAFFDDAVGPWSADLSSDLRLLALNMFDGTVAVFDVQSGERVQTLGEPGDNNRPWPKFSPDGTLLGANVGSNGRGQNRGLELWDVATGRELLREPAGNLPSAVAFSPDGRQVVYGGEDSNVSVMDIASGEVVMEVFGHTGQIIFAEFNASGNRLVTIARDGSARVWDMLTGQTLLRIGLDFDLFAFAALSPDDAYLFTSVDHVAIQVWGLDPASNREWLTVASAGSCGFSFSPDGDMLAVAGCDDSVRVLDANSGRPVIALTSPISPAHAIAFPTFSPDGTLLAAGRNDDNTVVVWDVATGRETLRLSGHTQPVSGLSFSPDGSQLATVAHDNSARLWDATSGTQLQELNDVFAQPVDFNWRIDVAFSPDGGRVATAGDASVRIWEVATGRELLRREELGQIAYTVAFSPDGDYLAVGFARGRGASVLDATTGEKLFDLVGHSASVLDIAYSPDGRYIVTGSNDATFRLWDAVTGVAQMTLSLSGNVVSHVGFSPDGTRLAAHGGDGTLRLYALRLEDLLDIALSRLTRWFTPEECLQYLHTDSCPPDMRAAQRD